MTKRKRAKKRVTIKRRIDADQVRSLMHIYIVVGRLDVQTPTPVSKENRTTNPRAPREPLRVGGFIFDIKPNGTKHACGDPGDFAV